MSSRGAIRAHWQCILQVGDCEIRRLSPIRSLIRVIYAQVPPAARAVMTKHHAFPGPSPARNLYAVVGEVVDGPATGPASWGDRDVLGGLGGYSFYRLTGNGQCGHRRPYHTHLGVARPQRIARIGMRRFRG